MTTTPEPDDSNQAEKSHRSRWWAHAVWAAVALIALIVGAAAADGDEGQEPTAATPAPTVTVTAEPEIVEVDPSEQTLAEIADREADLDEREAALDERAAELDQRKSDLDERADAISATEADVEEGTIPGDGIYLVGEDIKPGTYRGDGSSGMCYWARLSGTSGELDDVIANGLPEGPTVITIADSDVAFETNGCDEWVLQN